jgi:type I restriction enzyme S subunit
VLKCVSGIRKTGRRFIDRDKGAVMEAYDLKDSGVDCLGKIPEHWVTGKIKNRFFLKPSNVDKKSYDDEIPVELCNYVDVYYNDFVTNDLAFMSATATDYEIKKFSLNVDDVIITKDSEDPMDIAVPALVKEIKPNLVCGYHLTMLRKRPCHVSGSFLFWALKDEAIASQLYREATGVTRWAISSRNIKNVAIAYPKLNEQKAIADYLDKACANIDKTKETITRQIKTLTQYRLSLIHECVTGKKRIYQATN